MPVREHVATFPHGRIERKVSDAPLLYAVARHDGAGRVTWHTTYDAARRAGGRTTTLVKAEARPVAWVVQRVGRKWVIQPTTDQADLLMQEVRTPRCFATKREATEWLDGSLRTHAS
jgi:hypothetical protein